MSAIKLSGKDLARSMHNLLVILIFLPMFVFPRAHGEFSKEKSNNILTGSITSENISETSDKSGSEDKQGATIFEFTPVKKPLSGHLLYDLYAIPPDRFYIPYEPPIV